tara:strand:- start:3014 stop:4072 length:1059 start_codon:yes stop_codon:yes gene_type:complete
MAKSFKNLLGDDQKTTRTLLHEAIPITGSIVSGTYTLHSNVKTFSHGMFQSIYDYPFLSSSANHIFDLTYGHSSAASSSATVQNAKKLNIYNQMAQVLMGYTTDSQIRKFDADGELDDSLNIMNHCFFVNFSRLLVKDEIKKGSFRLNLYTGNDFHGVNADVLGAQRLIGDYDASNEFRVSPAGDYGLLFKSSTSSSANSNSVGLIFYQAGIAVLTASIFTNEFGATGFTTGGTTSGTGSMTGARIGMTIDQLANGFRKTIEDIDFNNTIELNSSIYFCRVNHNEFNYSANPTYLNSSKLVVKNQATDLPVSYITTIGLYSPDNELMAVAKLSEPIRKDPNTELTLRVRLDY